MSNAGSQAAASNDAARPRTASGTSCSRRRSKIAHAACFGKSPWDNSLGGGADAALSAAQFYGPPASAFIVPAADIYRAAVECGQDDLAVENLPATASGPGRVKSRRRLIAIE